MIIDDSRSMLAIMEQALRSIPDVDIETFIDPEVALEAVDQRQFDAIVVDYLLGAMDGIDVTSALRSRENYKTIPIVMVTSEVDKTLRFRALAAGVNDFINNPFDVLELNARIFNLLSLRKAQVNLARHVAGLSEAIRQATREIALREEEMIWRLALAIETRDGGTGDHVSRVAQISRTLALGLGLSETHAHIIYLAAPLHDVGKIGIPDAILNKPGRLTDAEMAMMRRHVAFGVSILSDGTTDLVRVASAIVGGHHEKWNGSGYPSGLAGEQIPIEARIVALADVFDALCSERPYKPAWPIEKAYAEIVASSGTHFDPACVDVFQRLWPEIQTILSGMALAESGDTEAAPTGTA